MNEKQVPIGDEEPKIKFKLKYIIPSIIVTLIILWGLALRYSPETGYKATPLSIQICNILNFLILGFMIIATTTILAFVSRIGASKNV